MKKTISPDRVGRRHLATADEKESVLSSELFKKHREPTRYPLDKPQDVKKGSNLLLALYFSK
jgi:hypothetical protein